ncbi:MAG: hypothetical protein PWQ31_900 [Eubacteriales bacterium]|nr:hypothetical protein [Eubacteriales bacterium]
MYAKLKKITGHTGQDAMLVIVSVLLLIVSAVTGIPIVKKGFGFLALLTLSYIALRNRLKEILVFLAIFIPYREVLDLYSGGWVKAVPDVLVALLFLRLLWEKKGRLKFNRIDFAYFFFLLIALASHFLNQRPFLAYVIELRSIVLYYLLYFILRQQEIKKETVLTVFRTSIAVSSLVVFCGIVEKITAKRLLFPEQWMERLISNSNFPRVYSLLNNPNTFAAYLLMVLVLFYYVYKQGWLRERKKWYFGVAALAGCGIWLSMSRSAFLALVVFVGVTYFLFRDRKDIVFWGKIVGGGLVVYLIVLGVAKLFMLLVRTYGGTESSLFHRFQRMLTRKEVEESIRGGRIFYFLTGLKVVKDYPLIGAGFGTYGDAAAFMLGSPLSSKYGLPKKFYADNEYIKVLVETGLLGMGAYLHWLYRVLKDNYDRGIKVALTLAVVFLGLFYNIWEVQAVTFYYWLLLALPGRREIEA